MHQTQTCHFWVGTIPEDFPASYFAEDYSDERGDNDPLSPFARDQGETWYDHDFLEYGWSLAPTIAELVAGYSYSEQWAAELSRRAEAAGLRGINFFVFIDEAQIAAPRSVETRDGTLHYMGTIEYSL